KRPETRGAWGEIQLRNVVEMAGMVSHCDFIEQSTIHSAEGRLRPDMLVRLPGGKLIVVDSKVPLEAYLAAVECSSEDERERHIADTARDLHRRLGRFIEPLAKVGRQLDSAVGAYNEAVGSFDHRVVPQVRRIELAGAASDRAVTAPPALDCSARVPRARVAADGEADRSTQAPSAAQLAAAAPSFLDIKAARQAIEPSGAELPPPGV